MQIPYIPTSSLHLWSPGCPGARLDATSLPSEIVPSIAHAATLASLMNDPLLMASALPEAIAYTKVSIFEFSRTISLPCGLGLVALLLFFLFAWCGVLAITAIFCESLTVTWSHGVTSFGGFVHCPGLWNCKPLILFGICI